ncbi:NADH-ubiquinone oxidoreductase-F iron-sulfur binding region domain-containing protein [Paraburkholderia sp. HP33-1]|uniref:NADH-ubiquinone oxidoreductase-F iron-sulfur binding region domain-containing protein n=1 Tax=Paraburkholderia sp. HP33-1 TaxID=2883243 RepID=UPI001F43EDA6|nr:NADH-ubiquinone oxidoreductase-F iron-sulfur binding region domain-containing protein [Paraburkholderia sp. HP33-1]
MKMIPYATAHSGIEPRLIVPEAKGGTLGLAAERALGTYARTALDPLAEIEAAVLRGRGGAGFPAHIKWRSVAERAGAKVVVANGEEGEPASFKDRWLLTHRPHLVLDGLLLAAEVVGAERVVAYLSHPETAETVGRAIDELRTAALFPELPVIDIHCVSPTYVAGEETAACQAISGGPALPKAKPPRPFESGVDGSPTLVQNVETLAHAAWISRHGAAEYRRYGTETSPGTTLVTLAGACRRPGVYEIPFGMRVSELFEQLGGGLSSQLRAFAMGGWFAGLLSPEHAGLVCCFEACKEAGSGWGCGAITALGAEDSPIGFAAEIAQWYGRETAGQCGVCVKGTAAIAQTIVSIRDGRGAPADVSNLQRWGTTFPGRGACAFLDGAATLSRSLVGHFAHELPQIPPAPSSEASSTPDHSERTQA